LHNPVIGLLPEYMPIAVLALPAAASLIAVRRKEIGGLEFAVYWFGSALFLFSPTLFAVAWMVGASDLAATLGFAPLEAAVLLVVGIVVLSGVIILAVRNRRLSKPEITVYLLGVAYMIPLGIRLG
jgi:hypothetical protein